MEFVVTSGFGLSELVDPLRAASIGCSGDRDHCLTFGSLAVFATDSLSLVSERACHLFDGQCSAGTRYFHPLLPATSDGLAQRIDRWLDDASAMDEINAGVFVAGRLDETGLVLVTDALSQYPLYIFQSGQRFIVSNVLRYITTVMEAAGLATTASLLPCLESTVLGGIIGDATHIREIRRLPFAHGLVAAPHLRFVPRRAADRAVSYDDAIRGGHAALMRHVVSVAEAMPQPRQIATDLTGGGDSRLVLSLLLNSPLRGELQGRSLTRHPHPDANVAGALFTKYGLPVAPMPVVVDADPRTWRRDLEQRRHQCNAAFFGGSRQVGGALAAVGFRNLAHFTGCFGGIGGAVPGGDMFGVTYDEELSLEAAVDGFLDRRRTVHALDLITDEGVSIVRRNLIDALTAFDAEGVPREQLQAELYLRTRCRSHFGLVNWLTNKSKISPDPLASPWLVEARRRLPFRLHNANKVILDLMLAGGMAELARMPMAEKSWDPDIVPGALRDAFLAVEAVTTSTPPLSPLTGSLLATTGVRSTAVQQLLRDPAIIRELQSRTVSRAEIVQTRFGNEMMIAGGQAVLHDLLERTPANSDTWTLIDRDAAMRYARRSSAGFRSSVDTGALGQVVSGMSWVLDRPAPAGIAEVRDLKVAPVAPPGIPRRQPAPIDMSARPDRPIEVDRREIAIPPSTDGGHRLRTFGHLLKYVIQPEKRTVLDLGAGHCLFSKVALRCGYEATAVDARTERLPQDLGPIRFIEADVRDFDPTGFGVVAILGLLYHLEIEDQFALLQRCAYGVPVVVETQVHVPDMVEEAKPWHAIVSRYGYQGVDFPEANNPMASIGNRTSFWLTEESLIRLFGHAGYVRVTLIDPIFTSVHGARRFYLIESNKNESASF